MTTARSVPVTSEGDGRDPDVEDAWHLVRQHGVLKVAHGSILRFRHGDGYSHSRALALQLALSVIPFLLALTGLAADLHERTVAGVIAKTIAQVSPGGGSSDALAAATDESGGGGSGHGGVLALVLGLLLSFGAMTVALGQVERGANRIFGNSGERDTRAKYAHAARLAAGLAPLLATGFLLLVAGGSFADAADQAYHWHGWWRTTFAIVRWPVGVALLVVALTVLLDRAPERRQPTASWLVLGTATSLVITVVVTTALAGYTRASGSFGQTYGPLAGVMALLVWSLFVSVALFYGVAVCAQLEALHAGEDDPTQG